MNSCAKCDNRYSLHRVPASKMHTDSREVVLSQVDYRIDRFIGDGIFDHAPAYTAVEAHSLGARVIIPPRKVRY
jgi:hypothetical protein